MWVYNIVYSYYEDLGKIKNNRIKSETPVTKTQLGFMPGKSMIKL